MKKRSYLDRFLPIVLPSVFLVIFTILALHRHLNLQSTMFDLGIMHQQVWTTLKGVYMHTSYSRPIIDSASTFSIEGAFRPILNIFVPIYAIFPDPGVLIFSQILSVAITGIPIFLFAKEKLKSTHAALTLQATFFLYPQTQNASLFDFHPITFSIAFLSWGFYLLTKDKFKIAFLLLTVSMFGREINALTVAAIGSYFLVFKKKRKIGISLIFLGTSYFLFVFQFLFKYFTPTDINPYFQTVDFENYSHFNWLGSNLSDMLTTIITKPALVLQHLNQKSNLEYLKFLSTPFYYSNLFSPIIMITIPNLLVNLLTEKNNLRTGMFHYESGIIPFFFFSSISTLSFINSYFLKTKKLISSKAINLLLTLFLFSFISHFQLTKTHFLTKYRLKMLFTGQLKVSQHAKDINKIKDIIEPESSVSTQNNLGPHFASRMNIYSFPLSASDSNYVLLDFFDPYLNTLSGPCSVCILPPNREVFNQNVRQMFEDKNYGVYLFGDGYLLFKNKHPRDLNEQTFSRIQHLISDNYFQTP